MEEQKTEEVEETETLETNDYEKFKEPQEDLENKEKAFITKTPMKQPKTPVKNNLFGDEYKEENLTEETSPPKIDEKLENVATDQNQTIDYFNPSKWENKNFSSEEKAKKPENIPIPVIEQIPLPQFQTPEMLKHHNLEYINNDLKTNNITDYMQLKEDNIFLTQDSEGQFVNNLRKTATPINPGEKRALVKPTQNQQKIPQNEQNEKEIINPNRVLKKIIISWCREENCQKKFNVYDDGSKEEIPMDEKEVNRYSVTHTRPTNTNNTNNQNINNNIINMEKSNMIYNNNNNNYKNSFNDSVSLNMSLISKEPHLNFFLDTGENLNSILLFRRKLILMENKFKDISNIVKYEDNIKPSVYHIVEEIDKKDLPPNLLFCNEEEMDKINKENEQRLNESKIRKGMLSNPKTIIRSKVKAKN